MELKDGILEIKCIFCTFSSNNLDGLRLHGLCHQANVADIMNEETSTIYKRDLFQNPREVSDRFEYFHSTKYCEQHKNL